MIGPSPVQSYLGRIVPPNGANAEDLRRLRERAWIEHGVICISPDEIGDEWLRQGLKNFATQLFGKRIKR